MDINLISFNGPDDNGRTVEMLDVPVPDQSVISDTIKCYCSESSVCSDNETMSKLLKVVVLVIFVASLSGCVTKPVRHIAESPTLTVSKEGAVELKGDAQVAPKVETAKSEAKMPLPDGTRLEFNEKLGTFTITLSKPSELVVNRTETDVQGPVAFTPDKGPTIGEEKQAQADYWTTLGLRAGMVLGIAAALFGLVRGWDFVMFGGGTIAAGCMIGLFIQKHPLLLLLIGIGAALAVAGPYLWHTKLKNMPKGESNES